MTPEHLPPGRAALWPEGHTIGRYEIVRLLGSGGMGQVYLARDARLQRLVALKCVDRRLAADSAERHLMLREARAAAGLTHPGIAHVYDVLDHDGDIVIVMEFAAGTSLRGRLAQGPCSVDETLRIGATIADALAHAHANGLVHCDIKPANIQLLPDGAVKILDFGVARRVVLPAQATTMEGQALLGGTPGYMSPEQAFGLPVDARSDVYSLGVVLFEMLTAKRPFESARPGASSIASALAEAAGGEQPADGVAGRLRTAIARALEHDPALRYQSAAEMRDALRGAAESKAGRLPSRSRRGRKVLLGWAIVVALLLIVSGIGVRLQRGPADPVLMVGPLTTAAGEVDVALAQGIAEMVFSEMSTVRELAVVRPSSSSADPDPAAAARASGATMILTGSVRGGPERAPSVHLELRSAPAWEVSWTRAYAVPARGYLGLRRTITRDVLQALTHAGAVPLSLPAAAAPAAPDPEAFAEYVKGRAALERRDLPGSIDRAVQAFEAAIARDQDFSLAHAGLAEASWLKYRTTDDSTWVVRGQQAAERAVETDSTSAQAHYSLGLLLDATGRSDEAVAELRAALDLQPLNDDAHRLLGRVLARRGRYEEGLAELQKAVAIRPGFWQNHIEVGLTHFEAGNYECAIASFMQVTALQPESPRGFLMLGAAQMARDELPAALDAFTRAITLQPDADAYTNIGTIQYWLGQYQRAYESNRQAIHLRPTEPLFHRNLGDVEMQLNRQAAALASYRRARMLTEAQLRVNPADPLLQSRLAVYEAKLGRLAPAADLIRTALVKGRGNAEVLYNAAVVQALDGQRAAAIASLTSAIQTGISGQVARRDHDLSVLHSPEFDQITAGGAPAGRRCS